MSSEPIGLVVSVNVGQPREVRWHGRTVTTAIWVENGRITRIYGITNPRTLAGLDGAAAVTRS